MGLVWVVCGDNEVGWGAVGNWMLGRIGSVGE